MSPVLMGTAPFRLIPVLDLRRGQVVRARMGERHAYAPIRTPLASGCAPADVARGLLGACPSDTLYCADLDAIMDGAAPDLASCEAVARACPGVTLWVDAGFSEPEGVARFLASGLGRPVIGSESQTDVALVHELGSRAVLSLDSRGAEALGPAALHERADLWPDDVIVMTLSRVGAGTGPDLAAIQAVARRRPGLRVYAAGGVRDPGDVAELQRIGAAGALVASAIHDGVRLGT